MGISACGGVRDPLVEPAHLDAVGLADAEPQLEELLHHHLVLALLARRHRDAVRPQRVGNLALHERASERASRRVRTQA